MIVRGLVIAVLILALAVPAARFYEEGRLVTIFYVLAGTVFIGSFQNIAIIDYRKHLQFDKDFRFNIVTKLVSFGVTVFYGGLVAKLLGSGRGHDHNDRRAGGRELHHAPLPATPLLEEMAQHLPFLGMDAGKQHRGLYSESR